MARGCSFYTAKYLLCFLNFIIFLSSTIVLATGVWLVVDSSSLISLFKVASAESNAQLNQPEVIQTMGYILIALSIVVFVISFFGYCGSIRNSRCLLMTYCILLIVLLIGQLAVVGFVYFNKDQIRDDSQKYLKKTISRYYTGEKENDSVTYLWNEVMINFECCGVTDYSDFDNSTKWESLRKVNETIPEACCIMEDKHKMIPKYDDCVFLPNEENSHYKKGCYDSFNNWLNLHREIFIITLLGINIVNVIAIVLGFCLFTSVKRTHRLRI